MSFRVFWSLKPALRAFSGGIGDRSARTPHSNGELVSQLIFPFVFSLVVFILAVAIPLYSAAGLAAWVRPAPATHAILTVLKAGETVCQTL